MAFHVDFYEIDPGQGLDCRNLVQSLQLQFNLGFSAFATHACHADIAGNGSGGESPFL